ncbi:hypothetical protein EJ377_01920 [Chryseobacterium arthrosphaerae]|uniref:Uncharacterized protein n=1 Tax=Chryseobacterium arthrosphaerae TaxID=651561 RepID=A0A3S0Q785_9FLAO|nr:hypothetical protein EJ377_01920 [Chryseobacterium arthrosphaerae]
MLQNETRKFLESGIVKFKIPEILITAIQGLQTDWCGSGQSQKEAMMQYVNSGNLYQAVLATFQNQDNDLSHLNNGLEAKPLLTYHKSASGKIGQPAV